MRDDIIAFNKEHPCYHEFLVSRDGNSWRASYTMLIKHHIIKGYLEEIYKERND